VGFPATRRRRTRPRRRHLRACRAFRPVLGRQASPSSGQRQGMSPATSRWSLRAGDVQMPSRRRPRLSGMLRRPTLPPPSASLVIDDLAESETARMPGSHERRPSWTDGGRIGTADVPPRSRSHTGPQPPSAPRIISPRALKSSRRGPRERLGRVCQIGASQLASELQGRDERRSSVYLPPLALPRTCAAVLRKRWPAGRRVSSIAPFSWVTPSGQGV
jgi:hypothetical protein